MSTFHVIVRTLTSVLLGLVVFGAFLSWMVWSTVLDDMEPDDGRPSLLPEIADDVGLAYEDELRRDLDRNREDLAQARSFSFYAVILGAVLIGLLHLPSLASFLRWPGFALLYTGLAAFGLGWLARAVLPGLAAGQAGYFYDDSVEANMKALLSGFGNAGLWIVLAGLLLLAVSYGWSRWKDQGMTGTPESSTHWD